MAFQGFIQVMVFDYQTDLITSTPGNGQIAICNDVGKFFRYNLATNVWLPFAAVNVKKSTVSVNGKLTANTLIYTLEATSLNFYPIMVVLRAVNIATVTTPPTMSIGTNASSYNNISPSSILNTILATIGANSGAPTAAVYSPQLAGSTQIFANVTLGAVATSYTFNVEIIGFYDV